MVNATKNLEIISNVSSPAQHSSTFTEYNL